MSYTLDSINSRLDTAEDYWTWNTATETIQKKQGKSEHSINGPWQH